MFMGEYGHTLDAKGRLIVPAKFREGLGEHFIVTKGLDKCLFAYPQSEWQILEDKLKALPITSADARKFVRFFFAGAVECDIDAQGRISIPPNLRQYAELQKDIISAGISTRVEIWSKDSWIKYNDEENYISNDLTEKMALFGI